MGLGRRGQPSRAKQVVAEAERLLSGRILDVGNLQRQRLPVWSLVNFLAHGTCEVLRQISDVGPTLHPASWVATLGDLAAEVLSLAPTADELMSIQRQVLVPLELQLLAGMVPMPATPAVLAVMVAGALDACQMNPGHES
jgi:hypothetical protein